MSSAGLRERKKTQTRRLIADTAARLFAEHGYEQVSVSDVAQEAGVAEQTVYNYFRTKEELVTDRDQQIQDKLCDLIRSRPQGESPAAAVRTFLLNSVKHIENIPPDMWRGELGYLATRSPSIHRLSLELTDRQATALGEAIADSSTLKPEVARLHGIALAGVFQVLIADAGQMTHEGRTQSEIVQTLYAVVANMLDEMDHWFGTRSAPPSHRAPLPEFQ
jgi:AcrR family transcriptional regulator